MPAIVDEHGKELEGACEGLLVMPAGYLLNFLSMQQQNDIMMVVYSYNAAFLFVFILKVMKQPWPGMARTIYGDHERFEHVYFSKFNGYYTTGDGKVLINHVLCTLHQTLCCDRSQKVEGFKMENLVLHT